MDEEAIERALRRVAGAEEERATTADVDAALERARSQIESLAAAAAELQATLPEQVGEAVRDGLRAEAAPLSRRVAEVRGLANQTIRRLERLEGQLTAERYSRVDDLGLLVDLITSGWRTVDERLTRIEQAAGARTGASVLPLDQQRAAGA